MRVIYDEKFYEDQAEGSQRSAAVVVPLLLDLIKVNSVVDVGCGIGTWLHVFAKSGITDFLGVDGDYVDRGALRIPESKFRAMNLRQEVQFDRRFDLAVSLEVAEHLPASVADGFVAALVRAAPLVLFSAAIPRQGGTDHINEQRQSYWGEKFARHGYEAVDCIRPKVFGNSNVEWWYQQNILLFFAPGTRPSELKSVSTAYELDRIHPALLTRIEARSFLGRKAAVTVMRKIKERVVRSVS